jgi:hypothetical protein
VTEKELVKCLLEFSAPDKLSVELDRTLLRIANYPALLANLADVGYKDGKAEVVFANLPDSVIGDIEKVIATSCEISKFQKDGRLMVGFRFDLSELAQITQAQSER